MSFLLLSFIGCVLTISVTPQASKQSFEYASTETFGNLDVELGDINKVTQCEKAWDGTSHFKSALDLNYTSVDGRSHGLLFVINKNPMAYVRLSFRARLTLRSSTMLDALSRIRFNDSSPSVQVVGMPFDVIKHGSTSRDKSHDVAWWIEHAPWDFYELVEAFGNDILDTFKSKSCVFQTKGCAMLTSSPFPHHGGRARKAIWWRFYLRTLPFAGSLPMYTDLNITSPPLALDISGNGGDESNDCVIYGEPQETTAGFMKPIECHNTCDETYECGTDECGNECGRGCYDGKVCDVSLKRCYKPLQPGGCLNAWILMQTGTDGNGLPYAPKPGDLVYTVGNGYDQSASYPLPSTMYERNIFGDLGDIYSMGSTYFQPNCGHVGSRLSFYVFEVKRLTGVMVTVKGTNSSLHWGSVDTILEIRNFDAYCSTITKRNNVKGVPDWYNLPTDGNDNNTTTTTTKSNVRLDPICNDDVDKVHGYGSRVESWLNVGKYVLVVGGYSRLEKGTYHLQVKSVPGCLPTCGKKQCGKENNCGTSCGNCNIGYACNVSSGVCMSTSTKVPNNAPSSNDSRKINNIDGKLPDLSPYVLYPSENSEPLLFRWYALSPNTDEFCVVTKRGNVPCFEDHKGWRLMVHVNMGIINIGDVDFQTLPNDGWEQFRNRCFTQDGLDVTFTLGLLSLEVSILSKIETFSNDTCAYNVVYRSPPHLSKFPIYDNVSLNVTNACKYTKRNNNIQKLSPGCGCFFSESNSDPCSWYDVTESYGPLINHFVRSPNNAAMITILVNPSRFTKENDFYNNRLHLPITKIPTLPSN